jgi:hypothetical protein
MKHGRDETRLTRLRADLAQEQSINSKRKRGELLLPEEETFLGEDHRPARHAPPDDAMLDVPVKPLKIELGNFSSSTAMLQALKIQGYAITASVQGLLTHPNFPLQREHTQAELVCASVGILTGRKSSDYNNILNCAHHLNLTACVPEVGPQLRLQSRYDEYLGPPIYVTVAPFSPNHTFLFVMQHADTLDVRSLEDYSGWAFATDDLFVFMHRGGV